MREFLDVFAESRKAEEIFSVIEQTTCILGSIASVQTGPFGSQLHQEDYVESGTPIITVEHLIENRISHENLPLVSDDDKERLSKYALKEGDIVFSRVGSVDRCAYVSKNEDGWLFSGRCLRIRVDETKVSPRYLSFYFTHPSFKAYIRQIAVGATMPSLNTTIMNELEIPLPPLPAQKKIAAILSSLDDKIEINTRMNKVLEEIARALFHRWFVEFEFPNDEGKPYKSSGGRMIESEMGEIPEGWKVGTVGDIATQIFSGGTPSTSRPEYWNGTHSWFSSGETRNHFVIDTEKSITQLGIENSSTKLAKRNDIVIASAGQGFTRGQVSYLLLDTYVNQSVLVIHCPSLFQPYLYLNLSGRYDELRGISDSSSIRGSLTTKMIGKFQLIIPSTQISVEFAKIFHEIVILLENDLHSNNILRAIRDLLLPNLIYSEQNAGNNNL